MLGIAHRINTIEELKTIPRQYGVEADLRDFCDRLILQHEPFTDGEDFEKYLKHFAHAFLLLNIKSERIEFRVLELLKKFKIQNYCFLDSSFSMIFNLSSQDEKNIALRFSEFEGLDTLVAMKKKAKWIWVDCFTKLPLNKKSHTILKEAGYKLCLTSPDLLGRAGEINKYKELLAKEEIVLDAVCAKIQNLDLWQRTPNSGN